MAEIPIEHDGSDQIIYIPGGTDEPMPLHLSGDDDLSDLVSERERAVLVALLRLALRKLGEDT